MNINLNQKMHIHFIGIGGIGMSGIAEVLLNQGHVISGSDMADSQVIRRLKELGAKIDCGHHEDQISGASIVVTSSAIKSDNPEVLAAADKGIPLVPRAKMLAALMDSHRSIAVTGTHGKTTATSLVASIFAAAGKDPTFVIGGMLKSIGSNARLGKSKYFIAEADESDASFMLLHPQHIIVTNIDTDHLSAYEGDFSVLQDAFVKFIQNVPEKGRKILCVDDPGISDILDRINCSYIGYGFDDHADLQASNYVQRGLKSFFTIYDKRYDHRWDVELNLPGKHNVLNALSAIAIGLELGIEPNVMSNALKNFGGVERRFQVLGEIPVTKGNVLVVEDYGHHPHEIAVTLDAARNVWPDKRIVMAYQPHRYSRTSELFDQFVDVLKHVDQLVLTDIYPAGEQPIPGISGEILFKAIADRANKSPIFVKELSAN